MFLAISVATAQEGPLPETRLLTRTEDLAAAMVSGIDAYLMRATDSVSAERAKRWGVSSTETSTQHRENLRRIIGAVDPRAAGEFEFVGTASEPAILAESAGIVVRRVRWPVFPGVYGDGILIERADTDTQAAVIVLPDADTSPEAFLGLGGDSPHGASMLGLVGNGARVLVMRLISRDDAFSGRPDVRMTNQPHREYIYRAAYEMGRHIIGYEVQKILGAIDCLKRDHEPLPVGVMGYGEGGLLALHAAALDERIDATLVSGYFGPRGALWAEPIYRNVWSYLTEFGDAEVAALVAPRILIVEHTVPPHVDGPPPVRDGRSGAAPGTIRPPSAESVEKELERARALCPEGSSIVSVDPPPRGYLGVRAVAEFAASLGISATGPINAAFLAKIDPGSTDARMRAQVEELLEPNQRLWRESEKSRAEFWSRADTSSLAAYEASARSYRAYFWEEVIGKLPAPDLPMNPRARLVSETGAFRGYEVTLDLYPGVFAYGILLVPKDIPAGERRPVVVCQHGLEGRPRDVADPSVESEYYRQFGCRLAERGYIVFAPQNPYIGEDAFRVLQRKANPLKLSLFSFIVRQHERILDWLKTLENVDPARIGFYGLSYGGKTAMRVPAILEDYALSICSGDYNEWIWKNTSYDSRYSYIFTGEYEMFEFNLGNTFNYAEMSGLILPRPFMVERGHNDGVAPDEWVAYEYARTRRLYDSLGLGDKTEIEFFNGPHTIHGVGTFEFLDKHLGR